MDEELINCQICFEPFDPQSRIPRLLPCSHCYCELCLDLQLKGTNGKALRCPECRQSHPVSSRRIKTFPQNKYTLALLRATKAMEGNDGQNQERFEVTKKCSVLPAEIIYRNEDMTITPKVPGQQDVSKGSPRERTDSICDICHVTLCDERNLYIHKFLKHGIDDTPEQPQPPSTSTSIINRIKSKTKNRIQHSRNTHDGNSDLVEFVDMSQMGLHGTPTSISCPICGAVLADQKNYDIHKMFHH